MKQKRSLRERGVIGIVVIYIIIILAAFITLYPFLYVIANSLSNPLNVIRRDVIVWPVNFSLTSYETLLKQKDVFMASIILYGIQWWELWLI